jgi:hypothetical protein
MRHKSPCLCTCVQYTSIFHAEVRNTGDPLTSSRKGSASTKFERKLHHKATHVYCLIMPHFIRSTQIAVSTNPTPASSATTKAQLSPSHRRTNQKSRPAPPTRRDNSTRIKSPPVSKQIPFIVANPASQASQTYVPSFIRSHQVIPSLFSFSRLTQRRGQVSYPHASHQSVTAPVLPSPCHSFPFILVRPR